MSSLYNNLQKLHDTSDDGSVGSLGSDILEVESDSEEYIDDDITSSDESKADEVDGSSLFWKVDPSVSQTVNKSRYSNELILNPDLLRQRSKSEANIAYTSSPKKRLSVDVNEYKDGLLQTPSFFKYIGNWFRGSFKNLNSVESSSLSIDAVQPAKRILKPSASSLKLEVRTSYAIPEKPAPYYDKKVIKFSESSDGGSRSDTPESPIEDISEVVSTDRPDAEDWTTYWLRSPNPFQCSNWEREFDGCHGVKVECKDIDEDIDADALIFPGNSFGILDGEPEARYIEMLGEDIAKKIQSMVRDEHDGELLVGQAILLSHPYYTPEAEPDIRSVIGERDSTRRVFKHLIYVPVMRVPSLVSDSVNAYLAFRAAILSVNSHNSRCGNDSKIRSVLCPALCGGIGRMSCPRLAHQMKAAYDVFAVNKLPHLRFPSDLGAIASKHVTMTSVKKGSWG